MKNVIKNGELDEDLFYLSGLHDCLIHWKDGQKNMRLEVSREAESFEKALRSAIQDVKKVTRKLNFRTKQKIIIEIDF